MKPQLELDNTEYSRGFRMGWSAVSTDYRRGFGKMRAGVLDALFNHSIYGDARRQILEALDRFQESSDWEFDLD